MRCECIDKTTMPIGRTCIPRLRSHPGYPCGNGELCSGNSVCEKGTCICPKEFLLRDRTCIEPPPDNSECDLSTKRCICKPSYQSVQGICRQLSYIQIGEFCIGPETRCSGGSYCVSGKCVCIQGLQNINGICKKMEKVLPGKSCTDAEECIGFSVCRERTCQCLAPRILRGNRCEVSTKVAIGRSCRLSDICLGGSSCLHNVCQCSNDEIVSRGGCIKRPKVKPGDICHANDFCSINPGDSCAKGEFCEGGSKCLLERCVCPSNYILRKKMCIIVENSHVHLGQHCGNGEICMGNSKCHPSNHVCVCPSGYQKSGNQCIKVHVAEFTKRHFATTSRPTTTITLKASSALSFTKSINEFSSATIRCNQDEDCSGGAHCRTGVCLCPSGMLMRNGICRKPYSVSKGHVGLIGNRCESNDDCIIAHSECINHECECADGFRIFGSTQCIPKPIEPKGIKKIEEVVVPFSNGAIIEVPIGASCNVTRICSEGSICVKDICECPKGTRLFKNYCRSAPIGKKYIIILNQKEK
uniref:EGF-like domain-containing protein n=1 Tax=Panagrolaimus superbus TaxID=310955 RepID=A0A914Z491_9BILA